mgnify:CR=1 FL=1
MTDSPHTRHNARDSAMRSRAPVFLDASGRRQRAVRAAAAVAVLAAFSYAALLVSALVGGPTIDAPFLPQPPALAGHAPVPSPHPSSPASLDRSSTHAPSTRPLPAPSAALPVAIVRTTPGAQPSLVAEPAASPVSVPSPTPTAPGRSAQTHGSDTRGQSGSAPGQTKKPTPPGKPAPSDKPTAPPHP